MIQKNSLANLEKSLKKQDEVFFSRLNKMVNEIANKIEIKLTDFLISGQKSKQTTKEFKDEEFTIVYDQEDINNKLNNKLIYTTNLSYLSPSIQGNTELTIYFDHEVTEGIRAFGSYRNNKIKFHVFPIKNIIKELFSTKKIEQKVKEAINMYKDTFAHELVHLYDDFANEGRIREIDRDKVYQNKIGEMRAKIFQILYTLSNQTFADYDSFLNKFLENFKQWISLSQDERESIKKLLEEIYKTDFSKDKIENRLNT